MEEKKKNKKKIIIIISIVIGVLLVGSLSYITYDKVFKKDNEVKEETTKEENNNQKEINSEEETTKNDEKDDYVLDSIYVDIKNIEQGIFGSSSGDLSENDYNKRNFSETFTLNGKEIKFDLIKNSETKGDLYINDKKVELDEKIYGISSGDNVNLIEATKEDGTKDYYVLVVANAIYVVDMDANVVNKINYKSNPIMKYMKNGKAYIMYWPDKCCFSSNEQANNYDKYYFAIGNDKIIKEEDNVSFDWNLDFEKEYIWFSSMAW